MHCVLYPIVLLPMCKKLSREHKSVILNTIEEGVKNLENHIDSILDNNGVEVEQCRTAKTGKIITVKRKK